MNVASVFSKNIELILVKTKIKIILLYHRLEVINLQTELDNRLLQRQARETGICPVRRELYSQCFGRSFIFKIKDGYSKNTTHDKIVSK